MNKLKLIQEEINKKINNRPIFYITKDYEKALGLEGLLPYLTMITPHQRFVSKTKLKLQEFEIESQKASTYRILQNSKVEEFIKSKDENALIQVFKINSQIERVSNENNFILLNPKSKLNLLFEQKISQYELLSQAGTNFPTTIITMLKDVNFNELKDNLGSPFVVQFNSSHTGSGTIFIDNEVTLTELQEKFPNRTVRIAKFVEGKTYTLNCVIYNSKTYFGGLSLQLTGLEKFSKNKGATVGNDWGRAKDLSE
ncbi:hypothetical protein KC660_03410, partial [Candidatus Dojkabacteria bacterium]|nr:hypothetical protein [Candidatus Dojkabacteria bacterium]